MKREQVGNLFDRISSYLDGRLSEQDEHQLLQELQSNPEYMNLLKQESSFRELIKTKLQRRKASPNLIATIKDRMRHHQSI